MSDQSKIQMLEDEVDRLGKCTVCKKECETILCEQCGVNYGTLYERDLQSVISQYNRRNMENDSMKKDGTKYLCYIEFPEILVPDPYKDGGITHHKEKGIKDWLVLHWGIPCGLSDWYSNDERWITFNGFAPKIRKILCYEELFIPRLTLDNF